MTPANVLKLILLSVLLLLAPLALAQLAGGSAIQNSSEALIVLPDGSHLGKVSNTVIAQVPEICALQLSPNGSSSAPAYSLTGLPGQGFYLPYLLKNTGTIQSIFDLALELSPGSLLATVQVILDSNNNHLKDADEGPISSINLQVLEQASLLLEIILPESKETFGELYVNILASCQSDPSISDKDNTSYLYVPEGGVKGFNKTARPITGSRVETGTPITYNLSFTVAELPLNNVIFSDILDVNLGEPKNASLFLNGVLKADLLNYDAVTHELKAEFATLNPGDRLELSFTTQVRPDAPGNTVIRNKASLKYDEGEAFSNEVSHTVIPSCGVQVSPDGDVLNPAYKATIFPSETLSFPYLIKNTGNTPQTFPLSLLTLPDSNLELTANLILDINQDGQVQEDEPKLTQISLEPNKEVQVLLVVSSPDVPSGDLALYDVIAACNDGSSQDTANVSRLSLGVEGASNPIKTANPDSATPLFPGANLSYFIDFAAQDKDLEDVVVSDTLSDFLEAPLGFSQGTLNDPETGLSTEVKGSFDGKSVIWTFARIPAGMHVRLELQVRLRSDIKATETTLLENTALLDIRGGSKPKKTSTNTVFHEIRPLAIQLKKTASPDIVRIGEPLSYTLTITNPSNSVAIAKLELSDDLPIEVSYLAGSSLVTLPDGTKEALEPEVKGQSLTWHLPGIGIAEETKVSFQVTVLPSALDNESIINTAGVIASDAQGRATADAAASASTIIDPEGFVMPAVLLGTVFIDGNGNRLFDKGSDKPVEGVRLYLPDGRTLLSDSNGRYTFLNLRAGTAVLKVDATTLPARFLEATQTEQKAGLWQLRLSPGEIYRQDIPLMPAGAQLAVDQTLNLSMGPVKVIKRVHYLEDSYIAQVSLTLSSTEALKGLRLSDGIMLEGELVNEQTFELGDVTAKFEKTLSYELETKDITTLLHAPVITWSLR